MTEKVRNVRKLPKNLDVQGILVKSLKKDFNGLIESYENGGDKSYEAFCQLAQNFGTTLVYHWCSPNTKKEVCKTREYKENIKYLIIQTAKSFWLGKLTKEADSKETEFRKRVGGFFLTYLIHGTQPSLPDEMVKIQVGADEMNVLDEFTETIENNLNGPEQEFYKGLNFILTLMKIKGILQPTYLPMIVGLNLINNIV